MMGEGEVPLWLKAMPLAPEFRPTEAEFADPIAYILKIEKEACTYGICKIIPPVPKSPNKVVITNLNRSLSNNNNKTTTGAAELHGSSPVSKSDNNVSLKKNDGIATFTTRQQQIGWSLKRPRAAGPVQSVVQKSVWQSGEIYTLEQFEVKAKLFSRLRLKTNKDVSPLMIESLFWKATADKPFTVEYANDIPGTAFGEPNKQSSSPPSSLPSSAKRKRKKHNQYRQKKKEDGFQKSVNDARDISNTAWNMRTVARSNMSLLRHMPDEIAGVTSPMVYIAMLFSWFAWHVEDHNLHSLNYLHMGAPKTWYAVPGDAASAFEEVVRVEGYSGQVNPLVALSMLGEKTTVMSPEVLIGAGVPCCRVVQNAGEFVVTFPRAYHLGFSHGFNCGEASNLATPEWLKVAKEAAVRRAATKYLPMLSHQQLLYLLALDNSRIPMNVAYEPHSSRLKDRQRGEGDMIVKTTFLNDVMQNKYLLSILLPKASTCHVVLWNPANVSCDFRSYPSNPETKSRASFCMNRMGISTLPSETSPRIDTPTCCSENPCIQNSLTTAEEMPSSEIGPSLFNSFEKEKVGVSCDANFSILHDNDNDKERKLQYDEDVPSSNSHMDLGPLACVACGVLGFASMAIIQPCQEAAYILFSTNNNISQNYFGTSDAGNGNHFTASGEAAITETEAPNMDNKNGIDSDNVKLNQHGDVFGNNTALAYQHDATSINLVNVDAVVHNESVGKSCDILSETNNMKESPRSSPNDVCMPKSLSIGNNSNMSQISALDLLAATYGDSIDSDEDTDSKMKNMTNPICAPSSDALMLKNSYNLCGTADTPKFDICFSENHNKEETSLHLSCMSACEVKKEDRHDICSIVNAVPKDSSSNFIERNNDVNSDASFHSPDKYHKDNATFHNSVAEVCNGFQEESHASCIQFPVVKANNQLERHILTSPVLETSFSSKLDMTLKGALCSKNLPINQSEDAREKVSEIVKETSGMIIPLIADTKGNLGHIELSANKSDIEIKPDSKSFTQALGISGDNDSNLLPNVYDCCSAIQVPSYYESKKMKGSNNGTISLPVRSNKTHGDDVAETGSLQKKICDTGRQSMDASSLWKPAKGFLRPRVFCLEHALEIEKQLQPMGGAHLMLLCHINYPVIEQEARLLAAEVDDNYTWKDIPFKNVDQEDLEIIHSAVDDGEDTEIGSSDWTMQLGMSLRYSVKLSKSPLYSKQMPYNPVLETLFFNSYLNNNSGGSACESLWDCNLKKQGKKSKHKKITVAGKWCGKVWMVNQVHPYLRSCEVQPPISLETLETTKLGVNQKHRHNLKPIVNESDCKPLLKWKNTISSEKHINGGPVIEEGLESANTKILPKESGAYQEELYSQKKMVQDSNLMLKPRVTITPDKFSIPLSGYPVAVIEDEVPLPNSELLTGGKEACQDNRPPQNSTIQDAEGKFEPNQTLSHTPSKQALMASSENTQKDPNSRRSVVKRKIYSEGQTMNIEAHLPESTMVDTDERSKLPNNWMEIPDCSGIASDADGFSTHPKINEDARRTALCLTRKKQRMKVEEHGTHFQAQNNSIKVDVYKAEKEIPHMSGIYEESKGCISQNSQEIADCNLSGLDLCDMTQTQVNESSVRKKNNRQSNLKGVEVPTSPGQIPCSESTLIKSQTVPRSAPITGELEGGPCTRLRPRSSKPKMEVTNKGADKALQQPMSSKSISKGKKKGAKAVPSKNVEEKNMHHCDTEGCTMSFPSKHDLQLHKRNICTFKGCGKHFFSHKYLVQHRRVHLDERPLSCPWKGCKMTFKWAWARTEHIRVHTGERPYVCTTAGCGQTFRFVSDFSRHKRKTGHSQKK